MSFRDIAGVAVENIATHLGESVTVDGHCVRGIPRMGTTVSGALSGVQVSSTDATVAILNVDADRIGVRKGIEVMTRNKLWKVRDFSRGNSGWTTLELES